MPTYAELSRSAKRLQALTSLRPVEFEEVLSHFVTAYAATQSPTLTQAGQPRQRQPGGGRKGQLHRLDDKLLFSLIYLKTYPLQEALGLQFGLSQSQTSDILKQLLPLVLTALTDAGYTPARDVAELRQHWPAAGSPSTVHLDGTERPRQRPKNPAKQREYYSGKKKITRTKT